MKDLLSPNATATVDPGSPPPFTNPFLSSTSTPDSTESPLPSEHTLKHINHLTNLGFTESEQSTIIKLNLHSILCHTEWPAFHWDLDALKTSARQFGAESGSETDFDFGAELCLESRMVCDLMEGEDVRMFVDPCADSTGFSMSNSGVSIEGLDPSSSLPIAEDSAEHSDTVQIISDDMNGEDIPRYGTPDFKMLHSCPSAASCNPPDDALIPTNIPLPVSRVGSGGSSEYAETTSYGADWDLDPYLDSAGYSFRPLSAFNHSSSYYGFISFESDPAILDSESALIEIEETEMKSMIGSSLATLLDLDELDIESFGQDGIVPEDLDNNGDHEGPVVMYSTSHREVSGVTLSSDAGSSNPDATFAEEPTRTPIDPIKLTQLSTIPAAGDPTLLSFLSALSIPPFPESQLTDPLTHPVKEDLKSCTKLQIMDAQGMTTNEVEAGLRCGCEECKPVAMKALFGDWDWELKGV